MQDKQSENHGVVVEIMIAVYWFKRINVGMRSSKTSSEKKKKKKAEDERGSSPPLWISLPLPIY